MWDKKYLDVLAEKRERAFRAGGEKKIEKQHRGGKLTARERLNLLFDSDTFVETGMLVESGNRDFGMEKKRLPGDGVITGYGRIEGRLAYASSEDFTVIGGTLGESHAMKICRIMDMAMERKAPYIALNDSGGARIEEGIASLNGYGGIFLQNRKASGVIPQIAVVMGPCAGGACYSPAMCDFVFMTEGAGRMFLTGPDVVKNMVGEEVTSWQLGGAGTHMEKSGVAHFSYQTDEACLAGVRRLLSYLPSSNRAEPPRRTGKARDLSVHLQKIVPDNQKKVYDVRHVIETFVDDGSFFEVQKSFGKSIVTGYARMDTEVLAIVANQPMCLGGSLDIDSSEKAARFVRFCDCFHIPILTLVDVPGFMPGSAQEAGGIIRRGAKLLYAYAEATVPKVSLIMRKAYGGAYIAMNSKGIGADIVYAWPIAQIAVMGAKGAVDIIFRREIAQSGAPERTREQYIQNYEEQFLSPYAASAQGYVDEVIYPEETRRKIREAFEALRTKESDTPYKKHGNIPL